jgi:8-amino-7-oxononanoate synthase
MNPSSSSIPVMTSPPGPLTMIDGRSYCYFAGTGYLGLSGHAEVIEAACAAVRRCGVHTATSRAGFGNNPLTLEVEQRAAEFFGTEDAFYFSSGYVANHILLQALAGRADAVFVDAAAHYCLVEAARLMAKPSVTFKHRDPDELRRCLCEHLRPGGRPLILTDGVFSVSGRLAPLREYLAVLKDFPPASLHIDDAHGFAVLGAHGRGVLDHFEMWGPAVNSDALADGVRITVCGTLAKAVGGFGGIIPGTRSFVREVRAASHYFDGASAPSSADAGATAKALEIALREPGLRSRLRANIAQLRAGLRALGIVVEDGPAANFSVEIGDALRMRRIHAELKSAGFIVPYVAAYSGVGPAGGLRFAVCAMHTAEMIDGLLAALRRIV